jgi:CRP-like cAMP-binding protein
VGDPLGPVASPARRYAHGDVIVRQGEPVACLRLVTAGAVRLSSVSPEGREVVVALLGAGDLFGEQALLDGGASPVEARALGGATVQAIHSGALLSVLRHAPATAAEVLRLVASRLHRTSAALEQALALDVPSRVGLRLREIAERHGTHAPDGVRLPAGLTQDELARMVGASRESVNRSLMGLAARGLVRTNGRRYVLPDPDALIPSSPR